ncbi:MAG: heavy metal translocating P-type ATPase [Myxococcota bacterium]
MKAIRSAPKAALAPAAPSAHVHGAGCGHDHGDHAGHDHGDHAGHDHGDHAGHDHPGHDHAPRSERPHGTRPAESGGAAVQVDLAFHLPGESDHLGRFQKLEEVLEAHHGVIDVHLRKDGDHPEICIHYDSGKVGLGQVLSLVRTQGAEVASRFQAKSWFVIGMADPQAADQIEAALLKVPGVLQSSVAYGAERLVVELDTQVASAAAVEDAVKRLGYRLELTTSGHACSHHSHGGGLAPRLEMPFAFLSGALLLTGFLLERLTSLSPMLSTVLYASALVVGGFFPAQSALRSLRQTRLDIESLMVLAAIGAGALGAWLEGAFLLFLFSLGHAFEHRALERARRAIEALGRLRPEVARVVMPDGSVVETPVNLVERGAKVLVRPGDRVPLDGKVLEGHSAIDQAAVTGESAPVPKGPGDDVFTGTINSESALTIEVTKRSSESVLARVVDMVAEAEAQKGPVQRFAHRLERRFVPIVVAVVVLFPIILIIGGMPVKDAVLRALNVLVAASPCALAIATPAAVLSAVARAARSGVLIKGGAYLEALGKVTSVAFDKTGTLTAGKCRVVSVEAHEATHESELIGSAAALEAQSLHPLALAVADLAKARGLGLATVSGMTAVHGRGLRGDLGGHPIAVGSLALFDGIAVPAGISASVDRMETAGQTTMVVRHGERFLGVLGVADTPRPGARAVLDDLRSLGIERTVMLSGDNLRAARTVAAEVGITDPRAPLMPAGKVEALKELGKRGGVAMVGDGVNDAPALGGGHGRRGHGVAPAPTSPWRRPTSCSWPTISRSCRSRSGWRATRAASSARNLVAGAGRLGRAGGGRALRLDADQRGRGPARGLDRGGGPERAPHPLVPPRRVGDVRQGDQHDLARAGHDLDVPGHAVHDQPMRARRDRTARGDDALGQEAPGARVRGVLAGEGGADQRAEEARAGAARAGLLRRHAQRVARDGRAQELRLDAREGEPGAGGEVGHQRGRERLIIERQRDLGGAPGGEPEHAQRALLVARVHRLPRPLQRVDASERGHAARRHAPGHDDHHELAGRRGRLHRA